MNDTKSEIESLKTEIVSLRIRLRRIEDFLQDFPSISDYINERESRQEEDPKDELFEEAKSLVIKQKFVSVSMLQRHLQVGYARASRIIENLEKEGIISDEITPTRKVLLKEIK